jgi:hypothetical protein
MHCTSDREVAERIRESETGADERTTYRCLRFFNKILEIYSNDTSKQRQ